MTTSKAPVQDSAKRIEPVGFDEEGSGLQMGELSELLGYVIKRAQLKVFDDFLRCMAPLQL